MKINYRDILLPANGITLLGLILVVVGAFYLDTWAGFILIAVGRFMDLLDGPVARATRVTSFSKMFDPTADKLALLAILVGAWQYHVVPEWFLLYLVIINGIIAILSVVAAYHHVAVGAIISGKLGLFCQNMALLLFVLSALQTAGLVVALDFSARIFFVLSVPFAALAIHGYGKLLRPRQTVH